MKVTALTAQDAGDALPGGRFRNPLPLSDGALVASHTSSARAPEEGAALADLRLRLLVRDKAAACIAPARRSRRASARGQLVDAGRPAVVQRRAVGTRRGGTAPARQTSRARGRSARGAGTRGAARGAGQRGGAARLAGQARPGADRHARPDQPGSGRLATTVQFASSGRGEDRVENHAGRQGLRHRAFPDFPGRPGARLSGPARAPRDRPAAARRRRRPIRPIRRDRPAASGSRPMARPRRSCRRGAR